MINSFPDDMPDAIIRQTLARRYGASGSPGYRGDVTRRTVANISTLLGAIDHVRDNPHDLANGVRIPVAAINFAQNSVQAPLAAGLDQMTRPMVKAFNDALHTHFGYEGVSDAFLLGLGAIMPSALEEGAALIGGGERGASPSTPGATPAVFPNNLVHDRMFAVGGPKMPLARAGPDAPSVAREGVDLTIGQRLGGHAKRAETGAASLPFVGSKIRDAQRKSLESFNRAVGNRALAQVDASLPEPLGAGHDTADYLRQKMLGKVKGMTVWPDSIYDTDRERPPGAPPNLSPSLQKEYRSKTDQIMADPALRDDEDDRDFDGYSGAEILEILSRLHSLADENKYQGGERIELGNEIEKFSDKVRALSYRQQPQYVNDLPRADQANEIRQLIVRAAELSNTDDGVYTPADLMAAVSSRYSGDGENLVSPAVANLYQFADRANRAMGAQYEDTGTSVRKVLKSMLAARTAESVFVDALKKAAVSDPPMARGAANAFNSASAAATTIPSFLGNALQLDPIAARTSPATALTSGAAAARSMPNDQPSN